MDLTSFTSAYEGIRKAIDTVRNAVALKQDLAVDKATAAIYEQLNAMRNELMTLHAEYDAVLSAKNKAESELVALKKTFIDKSKYQLHRLPAGSLVYRLHPSHQGADPVHHLCAHCYGQHLLSILQPADIHQGLHTFKCLSCNAVIASEKVPAAKHPLPRPLKTGW